jgi:two-component system, cell cycle sensor histidine kinase and response regulator CckA
LERQVAELQAMRLLVGGLAHDFNNLITAIQGHASLITAEGPSGEVQDSAEVILQASVHATAIAKQLQNLVRNAPAKRKRVDIHRTISEVVTLIKPGTGDQIQITQELTSASPITVADPEQMHQMLLNLALNARESMPEGGTLTFRTVDEPGAAGNRLVVSVRDTGCGIPAADRQRIFEPFFTTGAAGTGLGLAVVAGIVRKHQGNIKVESSEGRGSCFQIRLPLAAAALARAAT